MRHILVALATLLIVGCAASDNGHLVVTPKDGPAAVALAEAQESRLQEIADTARTGASETPLELPRLLTGFERIETLTGVEGKIRLETLERQVEADAKRIADLEAFKREADAETERQVEAAKAEAERIRAEAEKDRRKLLINLFSYGAAGMSVLGILLTAFAVYSANKQLTTIGALLFGGGLCMAGAAIAIDSVWFDRLVWACIVLGVLGAVWWVVDAVRTARQSKQARLGDATLTSTARAIAKFKEQKPDLWLELKPILEKEHDKAEADYAKAKAKPKA